jgi:hypothetical protein
VYLVTHSIWLLGDRQFKYIRLLAVQKVLCKLATAPTELRCHPKVHGTAAIMVHILNSVTTPTAPSATLQGILEAAALQHIPEVGNRAEAHMQLAAGLGVPALHIRGAYFLADIRKNPIQGAEDHSGFFQLAQTAFVLSRTDILTLYHVENEATLLSHLNITMTHNAHNPNFPTNNRIAKNHQTFLSTLTNRLPEDSTLDFDVDGISLQRQSYLEGPDEVGHDSALLSSADQLLASDDLNIVLNNILQQMCHDIMNRSPNIRKGGAYTTFRSAQLDSIPRALYQAPQLPFRRVRIALPANVQAWQNIICHLLPSKGHRIAEKTTAYPTSTYYIAWCTILNRLSHVHAHKVMNALRNHVATWVWLPYAGSSGMWPSLTPRNSLVLPEDTGPCPTVAANPTMFRDVQELARFTLMHSNDDD